MFIDVWCIQTCNIHILSLFMDMDSSHFPNEALTMSPDCSFSAWAFNHSRDHLEKVALLLCFSHQYMGQAPGTLANCKRSTTYFPHQLPRPLHAYTFWLHYNFLINAKFVGLIIFFTCVGRMQFLRKAARRPTEAYVPSSMRTACLTWLLKDSETDEMSN